MNTLQLVAHCPPVGLAVVHATKQFYLQSPWRETLYDAIHLREEGERGEEREGGRERGEERRKRKRGRGNKGGERKEREGERGETGRERGREERERGRERQRGVIE